MNDKIDIREVHPDLEPINGAPSLFSFYGFGARLYGNRDYSDVTRSSVKTLFITAAYIPIIPLKAYRVAKEGSQYYFLGKTSVSSTARIGSLAALAVGVLAIGGFSAKTHFSSDNYINGKVLAKAESAVQQGELANAVGLYGQVYNDSVKHKRQAQLGISNIVKTSTLQNVENSEFAGVLNELDALPVSPLASVPEGVYELAVKRVKEGEESDKIAVHSLLHAANSLNPEGEDFSELDVKLVKDINQTDPTHVPAAVELAELYYAEGNISEIKGVLNPVKDRLGDTEGARILGQLYISEGNNGEAYPLLSSYTSGRLTVLQQAEADFMETQTNLWDGEFDKLNNGLGPQSFYDEYDKKNDVEKQLYVDEYVSEKINNNPKYQASLEAYREASAIVPVVMDFGILQLRNAEGMTSEATRNEELKAAEATFLSIKNIVGETDDYKIYLGQVYFWLGKQTEGQALFDEVLESSGRSSDSLLAIASTLRSLGKVGLATELVQEAYDNSKDQETRYNAANFMQLLTNTAEDKITWLKRADPKSQQVQAGLKENQGRLAAQKGNTKAATKLYREAIAHSESLPESASNYNNTALIYFSLYQVSGDKSAYQKGVDLMSKAVELRPDESILLSNAASTLVVNTLHETLDDNIDYQSVQSQASISSLGYYYTNQAEKMSLREKVKSHDDLKKAIDYFERSILLSPNSVQNYSELYDIYYFLNDGAAIAALENKMRKSQIDVSALKKRYVEYLSGTESADELEKLRERADVFTGLLSKGTLSKATRGYLHDLLANNLISRVSYGDLSAAKEAVNHATRASEILPSYETESTLSNALLTLASVEASEKFPEYKTLRNNSVKSLSEPILTILMLNQNGDMASWLKSNPKVKQAATIEARAVEEFPDITSPRLWALLNGTDNSSAKKMENSIKESDIRKSMQAIENHRSSFSGAIIAYEHWYNQITGKNSIDSSRFETLASEGIVLPAELFK